MHDRCVELDVTRAIGSRATTSDVHAGALQFDDRKFNDIVIATRYPASTTVQCERK